MEPTGFLTDYEELPGELKNSLICASLDFLRALAACSSAEAADAAWNAIADTVHPSLKHDLLMRMPEPVDSIEQLAMFLAVIRPTKRHLAGLAWSEVAKTVWDRSEDGYQFKRAHAIAYSHVVAINMLLLDYKTT